MNKKLLILIIVIVVTAAAVGAWLYFKNPAPVLHGVAIPSQGIFEGGEAGA